MRKTKIVATIGPASNSREVLKQLIEAGMNVARINFSHGTQAEHAETIASFRAVRDELRTSAALMMDTKGPEIRLKNFLHESETLERGDRFTLTVRDVEGTREIASVTYAGFAEELSVGNHVLIDDGKIVLCVEEIDGEDVICTVRRGGKISNHKGINLPEVNLSMDYISPQDREDILFGIGEDVDYIAASFVRRADDVEQLRALLRENGGKNIKIISKIENNEGVDNFEEILKASDGIMVARGDLGVEVAYEKLPGIQKYLIMRCMQAGKIVITATQMLESMIEAAFPTRAEISDVANAVYDGTTAVMLSGETATGKYPVEAVKTMAEITEQAESDKLRFAGDDAVWHEMNSGDVTNAIGHAVCTLAHDIQADAILAATKSGFTANKMAKFKPNTMIIGATHNIKTYHQMAMMWGVVPILASQQGDMDQIIAAYIDAAVAQGLVSRGDTLVVSAGVPIIAENTTNMIRVIEA